MHDLTCDPATAALRPVSSQVQLPACARVSWQAQYGLKMSGLKAWAGRYAADHLYGHKAGVRAIKLLPQHNLLATGGCT